MSAFSGKYAELWYLDGSAYVKVADVTSIDGPSITVGTSETTDLEDTAATYIGTYMDGGELSGSMNYDPQSASHQALTTMLVGADLQSWKMVFGDVSNSTFEFDGILTGFSVTGVESSSHVTADYTIKVSGVIDFDGTAPA